jgi:hypothetical protein
MPTAAPTRTTLRSLDITDEGRDQLLAALNFFFGEGASHICWHVDESGHHLATMGDGPKMIPEGTWFHRDRPTAHLPFIAEAIIQWLDEMDHESARKVNSNTPMGSLSDLNPNLTGFRVVSERSRDGEHYMLTIIPAWE